MCNQYGLPECELDKIRGRDKVCVYCHKKMKPSGALGWRGDWATIEHLNIIAPWSNHKTVVICCWSCNSSRGNKKLLDWFGSKYCLERDINLKTVTAEVKKYIKANEK